MSQTKLTTTLLVILDGWGVTSKKQLSAIRPETAPNFFGWNKKFPYIELDASGEAVGLFKGQEGNSEAGHLNIGAGRVVKQDGVYISDAIEDGTFFKNNAFIQAFHHVKKYKTKVHLMGLLSNHNSAHACPEHIYALLDLCRREGISEVYLHLFTDGRDSGVHDAPEHLKKLREHLTGTEKIASIMGRFYAMDRNKNWDRMSLAYHAMVMGESRFSATTAEQALEEAYKRGETDEFVSPTVMVDEQNKPVGCIDDNDIMIFFNLRSDRARQLTKSFVQTDFEKENADVFTRKKIPHNTRFVAMTDFGPELDGVFIAFPSRDIHHGLVETLCPLKQLYVAETEKYAHITYFLNGGYSHHFCGEQFVKIESDRVESYSLRPEMKARLVSDYIIHAIKDHRFDFIAVNFANADMVGHTGDFKAVERAVKILDEELGRIVETLLKEGGRGIITADHGNAEEMQNDNGAPNTEHSTNKVPCYLLVHHRDFKRYGIPHTGNLRKGKLANIAPTILKLMHIKQPKDMTAKPLF